jgi:hypothetical protein
MRINPLIRYSFVRLKAIYSLGIAAMRKIAAKIGHLSLLKISTEETRAVRMDTDCGKAPIVASRE